MWNYLARRLSVFLRYNMASIYIHIPFCERKCKYCSFVSYEKCNLLDRYIESLLDEIRSTKRVEVDTIYIGGGTPSLLSGEQLSKILSVIRQEHNVRGDAEISIECNPNSITRDKLLAYKSCGVNRVSVGVQSLNDKVLDSIGRLHTGEVALNTLRLLCEIFDNVSADLIIGLPYQSKSQVIDDIKKIAPFVTHFSVYSLMLESGTKLFDEVEKGDLSLPNEDAVVDMYDSAVAVLKDLGFDRYEVSNFGQKCEHNLAYWTQKDYYGFGVASHSYVKGVRYCNTESLEAYLSGERILDSYTVGENESREEYIMLRMRLAEGFLIKDYFERFGVLPPMDKVEEMKKQGLVVEARGALRATELGFHLLNHIILKLLD